VRQAEGRGAGEAGARVESEVGPEGRLKMLKPLTITVFPALFLIVLFGGGILFRCKQIDMGGKAPIDSTLFHASKYAIVLLWAAMVASSWGAPLSFFEVPGALRGAAVLLWAAGYLLLLIGRFGMGNSFRIGSPREPTGLKVNGLFAWSRNPMYIGVYATLLAVVLYTLNPILLVVALFVMTVHHRIVLAEERYLTSSFGSEYADYCRRVRRYL
jgi:protein-S-isoprenylcysteine O-methyltransferase Ste14